MTAPNDALGNARAWHEYALTRTGPERDEAIRAAAYWFDVHRRATDRTVGVQPGPWSAGPHLGPTAVPSTTLRGPSVPSGPSGPSVWSIPSGPSSTSGFGRPGTYQPGYAVPGVHQPGFAGPPRTGPPVGAPPARRAGRGGGVVVFVTVFLLVVAGLAVTGATALVREMTGPEQNPTAPAYQADPETGDPAVVPDPAPIPATPLPTPPPPAPAGQEADWKAGLHDAVLPDPVPSSRDATPFLPDHSDPSEWLVSLNSANEGIRVVFTDDVAYNCGMQWIVKYGYVDSGAAGCFNPAYPRVLFMYWAPSATPELKEFVLAHELSHLIQWWQKFDIVYSAEEAGIGTGEEWKTAVETDATCRVLSWGGYSREVAEHSSSPCTTDAWSEDWLAQQAADLGVTIVDY